MAILGIHALTHDSSAAVAIDGKLAAFAQEERFSRIKGDASFPENAIRFCLGNAGIKADDIERVVIPFRPWAGALSRLVYHLGRPHRGLNAARILLSKGRKNLSLGNRLKAMGIRAPVERQDHYQAHARAVFLASPFESSTILVIDGVAEGGTGAVYHARRRPEPSFYRLGYFSFPESLGLVYAAVTEYLGFRHNMEEGKVMAMAAYGNDDLIDSFSRACRVEKGRILISHRLFDFGGAWTTPRFEKIFGPPRLPGGAFQPHHFALARALQRTIETSAVRLAEKAVLESRNDRLCFTGGLALNPAINSAVARAEGLREVFLLPAGGDAGTAIGAALSIFPDPDWQLETPYWGHLATPEELHAALNDTAVSCTGPAAVQKAAGLLARGAIGGVFAGRSEMGPRALGHRSILADPGREGSKERLNRVIKQRQDFQPFAPCVLEDMANELFPGITTSPFMLRTQPVNPAYAADLPAVIHHDGTARVQTVRDGDGSRLAPLLRAFAELGRLPVLLNTSLNLRGEPLVETPAEALAVFRQGALDFLLMEDALVEAEPHG